MYDSFMSNATETAATQHRCLRPGCGRVLKSAKSVALGYGPVCAAKIRAAALAEARADFTAEQADKAAELIRDGGIVTEGPGLYAAVSSKGTDTYATDGHSCTCPSGAKDRRCYHTLAARILTIASRRQLAKAA
jgi:hypothetical protein